MNNNVVLIGFMGAGKSTIGKILAEKLEKRFIETDDLIEEKAEKSIPKIFEEEGENRFREYEKKVIKEITAIGDAVISCGGGVVLNSENIKRLKKKGVVVLLTASLEEILQRISEDTNRPLMSTDLRALLKERAPLYASAADITVNTECSVNTVIDTIMRRYYEYCCEKKSC